MPRAYIEIHDETMYTGSNPAVATYKKVSVLWNDFSEGATTEQDVERTASGKLLLSLGKRYRAWKGLFKIDATPKTGYASKEDVLKWSTSTNALERQLTMKDTYGNSYQVFILTPVEFKYGSPVPDGYGSFFLVPFEMQTQEAV